MSNSKTMSFLSSGAFWGAIIILFGLSIILREVFHVHIPFVRIAFGCLLLYWGLRMITGGLNRRHGDSAVFSEANMSYDGSQKEYNIVFGSSNIDLFKMDLNSTKKLEIN